MRVLLIKKEKIKDGLYELSKKEENYLKNVLRIEDGVTFKAKDEKETLYDAVLIKNVLSLVISNEDTFLDEMPSFDGHFQKIDLYQGIMKGKKNEKVVREAQETGVSSITFFSSSFTQTKMLSKHDEERLSLIRREAVQQSGAKTMQINEVKTFKDAIDNAEGRILILHQSLLSNSKDIKEALSGINKDTAISCFIGSEGGFSDEEVRYAEEKGAIAVLLKTNILRSETAAIYAISAIQTLLNY